MNIIISRDIDFSLYQIHILILLTVHGTCYDPKDIKILPYVFIENSSPTNPYYL